MKTKDLEESIRNDELEGKEDIIYWTKALILEIRKLRQSVKELDTDL